MKSSAKYSLAPKKIETNLHKELLGATKIYNGLIEAADFKQSSTTITKAKQRVDELAAAIKEAIQNKAIKPEEDQPAKDPGFQFNP